MQDFWIATLLPLAVFGFFILFAIVRIRNARRKMQESDQNEKNIGIKLDVFFSSFLLIWTLVLLVIFVLNFGR
jgi:hypothetical protein